METDVFAVGLAVYTGFQPCAVFPGYWYDWSATLVWGKMSLRIAG